MALHALDLCAGYGGFSLGLRLAEPEARTVCYVEREAFCAALLVRQMEAGWLDQAPVWSDLTTFDARGWRGCVDVVTAGFPCQPFSAAGKRLKEADERWIWPDIARIVDECRPRFVFLENVSLDAFRRPRTDLGGLGYRVPPAICISARGVGAPHLRKRWWCLAHAHGEGLEGRDCRSVSERSDKLSVGSRSASEASHDRARGWWLSEPDVGRVAHGVADRVDRVRAVGNGVVPLAVAHAWRTLRNQLAGSP